MAGQQADAVQLFRPFGGRGRIGQRQVERRRGGDGMGGGLDHILAPIRFPARLGRVGQSGDFGEQHAALGDGAEHAMDQLARAAIDQRQHGRDRGMRRGAQRQHLDERDAQRETRLGIVGQPLLGRRVDQRVEIGQTTQRLGRDGVCQTAIRSTRQRARRRGERRLQRFTPAQHGVEQADSGAAGGGAQRLGRALLPPAPVLALGAATPTIGSATGWRLGRTCHLAKLLSAPTWAAIYPPLSRKDRPWASAPTM